VYFEFWVDCEEFLKLVLCIDGVPVAIGAVSCQKRFGLATAWLTFGMVSPPTRERAWVPRSSLHGYHSCQSPLTLLGC
jgi:hypothetical protein